MIESYRLLHFAKLLLRSKDYQKNLDFLICNQDSTSNAIYCRECLKFEQSYIRNVVGFIHLPTNKQNKNWYKIFKKISFEIKKDFYKKKEEK